MISLLRASSLVLLLALSSCSSDAKEPAKRDPDAALDLSRAVYVGSTTDEALERLVDATLKDDPNQYVIVDAPDLSEPLSADTPATFEYHLASQASRSPRVEPAPAAPPAWQRSLRELVKLLGPLRVAHAHGAPYNGIGYFLNFKDADQRSQLLVFTSKAAFTPDAEAWQTLADAKQPLELVITSAYFEENDIPSDGGPFVGGSFELRVE